MDPRNRHVGTGCKLPYAAVVKCYGILKGLTAEFRFNDALRNRIFMSLHISV